jgi:hypothetical protein
MSKTKAVDFKPFMTCSECAKTLNELTKHKQDFLRERAQLMRCQGCERLQELKKDER